MSRRIISTTAAPAAIGPYSQAVQINGVVYTSGQIGLIPETGEMAKGLKEQTHQAFKNLSAILQEAGSSLDHVVKFTLFLYDMNDFAIVNEIMKEYVSEPYPARSTVGVEKLPKDALFEVEAVAMCA